MHKTDTMEAMENKSFDGQQEGERILYTVREHPFSTYLSYVGLTAVGLFVIVLSFIIAASYMYTGTIYRIVGSVFGIGIIVLGGLWTRKRAGETVAYITDRRIMRFECTTPFYTAKRALFWNEALKAKAVTRNLFWKILNIGSVVVETQVPEQGDVYLGNVYYYDDLVNYIDKILFVFKNSPAEIAVMKPFVPKPKGNRD